MSERLPAIRPREAIRALEKAGWHIHRQKGSHVIMRKAGSRAILTIPVHSRDLPRGTLHGILTDAGLTTEEFTVLLKE